MLDVITIGSNTVDIFAHTDRAQMIGIRNSAGSSEYISYPVGAKMLINKLLHNFGGNGMNAAVSFSRLGLKAGYIGKVGRDANGKSIILALKREKITFLGARGDETGLSIVLDAMEEDRTILTYKGCNNELRRDEVSMKKIAARWLYLSSMLGQSLETMLSIARQAKAQGTKIAFNPSATLIENQTAAAHSLCRLSDVLVLNKEEAESLIGKDTIEANLRKLQALGPAYCVITDGKNGAVALNKGVFYKARPQKDLKIQETTGAGDAFASALTAGIMLKKPFETCLRMAITQSEAVIQGHGAQNNLMTRARLEALIKRTRRQIEQRKAVMLGRAKKEAKIAL